MTEQCVICLENMNNNTTLLTLECSHIYHKECIDDWLNKSQTCPMCREKVEPDNTIRDLAINRFMRRLKLVQLVTLTDVITTGVAMMCNNYNELLQFICALWGFWGSYRLNMHYLILYGISRVFTIGIIGYKMVIYITDDIKRIYDTLLIIYYLLCIFYMYITYIILILALDMNKYRNNVTPLIMSN